MEIRLNQDEYEYLCAAAFIPNEFRECLYTVVKSEDFYLLGILEDQADEIGDLCGVQLQRRGFDINYDPTPEGVILESLIDKFFTG